MKATLEIPATTLRRAKSAAARRGIALGAFVTGAVEEKLATTFQKGEKPFRLAGGLRHLHKETIRINRIINDEFEEIEFLD